MGKFADSPNAKTILFPVEATQLIGSLGGIGELVRGVVGSEAGTVTTQPDRGTQLPPKRESAPVPRASVPRSGDS